jgi:hypothetical protein
LKVHRSLIYLLKKVLNQNQDAGLVRCPFCPKLTQKLYYGLTQTVDFVTWPPKTQPKSPMIGEGQHEVPLVQGNLASKLKINTKKVFWPHKDSGFCGLAAQNTAKSTQDWQKANLKDHWSKEIWPPCSKDCNPLDYFMWSKVEREVNKDPQNTLASLMSKISEVMADMDSRVQ